MNWTAVLFFILAVILVAQSSITIFTYNKNNTVKDLNYYWSVAVLVASLIGLIVAGVMSMKAPGGTSDAVTDALAGKGNLLAPVNVEKITASGTPDDVETLLTKIQSTGAQVKTKIDQEIEVKERALKALLEVVQERMTRAAEAMAALKTTKVA